MSLVRTYHIPGLATVHLDTSKDREPALTITLEPGYDGDLRDFAPEASGAYLTCDHASAINNPRLARFVETMKHWDHDFDGIPDCDHIIEDIEEALWQSREEPEVFHRPTGGWYTRLVIALLPPAPDRHIVFSFGELRPRFRWYHHVAALPMLALFIGLVYLQTSLLPWMSYNVITGLQAVAESAGVSFILVLIVFFAVMRLGRSRARAGASTSPHTYGFFNKAALLEEQGWREGSERWSILGRFRSCVSFGLIHMVNLIYPLASILPLAIGGGLLTYIYLRKYKETHFRRTATLEAAVWHRVYNRIALIAVSISLISILSEKAIGMFAAFAVVEGFNMMLDSLRARLKPVATPGVVAATE